MFVVVVAAVVVVLPLATCANVVMRIKVYNKRFNDSANKIKLK